MLPPPRARGQGGQMGRIERRRGNRYNTPLLGENAMGLGKQIAAAMLGFSAMLIGPAAAQPRPGDFTLRDFTFHTGQTMALRQHYVTLGDPNSPAVLVLHG